MDEVSVRPLRIVLESTVATIVMLLSAALSCAPETRTLPPLGEVLVVVDTDMKVPTFVSHLRVDLYALDGTWYDSEDSVLDKTTDWPTSFGLYVPEGVTDSEAWVRIRAYPEGSVRDYRGERFAPRPTVDVGATCTMSTCPLATAPPPAITDQPRLVLDGTDLTPPTEPAPLVTIDRLLLVRVPRDVHSGVHVVLHGACVGTMADFHGKRTCVDTENVRVTVTEEPTSTDTTLPATSLQGTWNPTARCTSTPRPPGHAADGTPLYDEEVCVDGAMFTFGSSNAFGIGDSDDLPARVAILPPFRMDRYEVTVARWREALAQGFQPYQSDPSTPVVNDAPLPTGNTAPGSPTLCTWSTVPQGREDFPLTCLFWPTARSFCQWLGGNLPTETQWEYVTADAGRPLPTPYPWGGDEYSGLLCSQAAYGRGSDPLTGACNGDGKHFGPLPVEALSGPGGDVSLQLGIVNLAGNVEEYMLDAFANLSSNCWAGQPLEDPACRVPALLNSLRGGSWIDPIQSVFAGYRSSQPILTASPEGGFRCVRPGT
jgi:formylglycine-generating enzyme required for sulfatase activity